MSFIPFAHALAARQDLPVPAWLFAWAASIVLIVSFFALSAAWREPKFEDEHARPLGERLSAALLGLPVQIVCGAVGVFLLGVILFLPRGIGSLWIRNRRKRSTSTAKAPLAAERGATP